MKRILFRPTFEMVFSVAIIMALCVPQFMLAQNRKDVRIVIRNSDTLYNGKNIKDLPADERQEAMARIGELDKNSLGRIEHFNLRFKRGNNKDTSQRRVYAFDNDTAVRHAHLDFDRFRDDNINGMGRVPQTHFRMESSGPIMDGMGYNEHPVRRMFGMRAAGDVQSFDYTNTDKSGISTHVSFEVSEARGEAIKIFAGAITQDKLELSDLTLMPQFTAGKTVLNFSLPGKAAADVELTDSEGKTIWKDKAISASYSKAFTLGLNGVYYLLVKQSGKTALKRIVKE